MTSRGSLSKRTRSQYLGNKGEAEVLLAMLELGASVNGLTASDHGWDLHVHLPEAPVVAAAAAVSWRMSGRALHVQVKRLGPDTRLNLRIGTVRAWLSGATAGTPTFLAKVNEHGEVSYATPLSLSNWLANEGPLDDEVLRGAANLLVYEVPAARLPWLLHAWSLHAPVLLSVGNGQSLEAALISGKLDEGEATKFVTSVGQGWVSHHMPGEHRDNTPWVEPVTKMADAAADVLGLDDDTERERFVQDLLTEFYSPIGDLPTACYSQAVYADDALADAINLCGSLLSACFEG